MKHVKQARKKPEPHGLLLFSVALFLISPIETSDEHAPASIESAFSVISDMRN